jgi:hypothetical protein
MFMGVPSTTVYVAGVISVEAVAALLLGVGAVVWRRHREIG